MPKIEELRALLAKATPGPWHADDDGTIWWSDGAGDYDVANPRRIAKDDAAVIVAAVNALPALLDVATAAETAIAGHRRPQAVPPSEWYAALETMAAALAKLETT